MSTQVRSHSAIARELWRIKQRRRQPVHPGYVAIVAKAHELGLPKRATTDITMLDRRLIMQRRPRQFAWLLHDAGSLLSIPEPNERPLDYLYAAKPPQNGSIARRCHSGGTAANSCVRNISMT